MTFIARQFSRALSNRQAFECENNNALEKDFQDLIDMKRFGNGTFFSRERSIDLNGAVPLMDQLVGCFCSVFFFQFVAVQFGAFPAA